MASPTLLLLAGAFGLYGLGVGTGLGIESRSTSSSKPAATQPGPAPTFGATASTARACSDLRAFYAGGQHRPSYELAIAQAEKDATGTPLERDLVQWASHPNGKAGLAEVRGNELAVSQDCLHAGIFVWCPPNGNLPS